MANESFISIDTDAGICTAIPKYLDLSQLISINDGFKGTGHRNQGMKPTVRLIVSPWRTSDLTPSSLK